MALHHAWFSGKRGSMASVEQAKLWALREVLSKQGESTTQWQWMSEQVSLVGGGHPTREAVRKFFLRVDSTASWHPGHHSKSSGRLPELTQRKRQRIAESMMALKRNRTQRAEPSYEVAVSMCPKSTTNEATGNPFSRGTIDKVLTTDCYDKMPDKPWRFTFGARAAGP